jgi:hypothetical protein
MLEITPNNWFDQLSPSAQPVTSQALQDAGLLPSSRIESMRMVLNLQPEAPAWRTPGTPEWLELHEHLFRPTLTKRLAGQGGAPGLPSES